MHIKMNKVNFSQWKIKDGLFLDRNTNVSAISYSAVLSYFACISNACAIHRECITSASYCGPRPHYIQHSIY